MRPVSRIDAHAQLRDPSRFDYSPLGGEVVAPQAVYGPGHLRDEMDRVAIEAAIVVGALASLEETRHLLAVAAADLRIRGVIGWVDLTAPDLTEQLDRLRSGPGGGLLVGLYHPVEDEADPAWLTRPEVRRGLRAVQAAGLAFDLPVTTRELGAAERTCRDLPELRFVIDHLGVPPIASGDLSAWGSALLAIAELPNVNAKLSGLVTAADWHTWSIDDLRHPVELAVDAFGAGRLMLGSDWPRCLVAGSYVDVIDACRYLLEGLLPHGLDEVRGITAARVYRINQHQVQGGPTGTVAGGDR